MPQRHPLLFAACAPSAVLICLHICGFSCWCLCALLSDDEQRLIYPKQVVLISKQVCRLLPRFKLFSVVFFLSLTNWLQSIRFYNLLNAIICCYLLRAIVSIWFNSKYYIVGVNLSKVEVFKKSVISESHGHKAYTLWLNYKTLLFSFSVVSKGVSLKHGALFKCHIGIWGLS